MSERITGADVFDSFAPFIKDFIYSRGWERLHPVQSAAAEEIFFGNGNLLLTSSTASGKTEAAFFPCLSRIWEEEPQGVGILYVAPLKCLINDQFERIEELCCGADIPVCRWHGDVGAGEKTKFLEKPRGVLQITPESLESMLMRRGGDVCRIFGELRYVIIDEIHILTGTDRGNQIICQLARLERMIGYSPRRIGLSATVGDPHVAAQWLGGGTGRDTVCPEVPSETIRWRLAAEHFYITGSIANTEVTDIPEGTAELLFEPPTEEETAARRDRRPVFGGGILQNSANAENRPEYGTAGVDDTNNNRGDENSANAENEASHPAAAEEAYEFLYDSVKDKKAIVFSNSREETEHVCATLRQIADKRREPDVFLIHHGNLSASIREDAELKMKRSEGAAVTCASVTMELGIDIGRLERVAQMGAATSVSSFLQRLGRSGRREAAPEMIMVLREEEPLPNAPLPDLIPWDLLRAIAVAQLYIEERFIEPPRTRQLPYSLLFHQTLSVLASGGGMMAAELAERVLSLPPFFCVEKEDYKLLLLSMIRDGYLEMMEDRELIVGLKGETLVSSFKFFAVFKDSEDYTVRCGSDEIGTITKAPPKGDRFALAGRVWQVEEVDAVRRLVFVMLVPGKGEISWPGDYGEIHTKILLRMHRVLTEDTEYPYLREGAVKRLREARAVAAATGMKDRSIIPLGGSTWAYFPWLGTVSFRTMRRYLQRNVPELSGLDFGGCCYMTFKLEGIRGEELLSRIEAEIKRDGLDTSLLVGEGEAPAFDKYDPMVPPPLLRRAFAADRLRADEIVDRCYRGGLSGKI